MLDAVQCAMTMLKGEPTSYRHVILLLSEARNSGSQVGVEAMVRELGEGNTTIDSLIVDGERRDRVWGVRDFGNGSVEASYQSAVYGLREDTAATLAKLSGGEWVRTRTVWS